MRLMNDVSSFASLRYTCGKAPLNFAKLPAGITYDWPLIAIVSVPVFTSSTSVPGTWAADSRSVSEDKLRSKTSNLVFAKVLKIDCTFTPGLSLGIS